MPNLAALSIFLFLVACSSDLPPESDWRDRTVYSHTGIGYSGTYTPEYESVLDRSLTNEGVDSFLEDLHSSDPAVRLYGLLGLKISGSDEYGKHLDELLKDDAQTPFGEGGCIVVNQPLSSIARIIDQTPVEILTGRRQLN